MTPAEIMRDLDYLTGSPAAGRLSGTPGAYRTAAYLAGALQAAGFQPAGTEGFFDSLDVPAARLTGPALLTSNGRPLRYRQDFAEMATLSRGGAVAGPVLVAVDGDAFAPGELQGRIVLIAERPPAFNLATTAATAADLGAAALLVADQERRWFAKTVYAGQGRLPVLRLRQSVAADLAGRSGRRTALELPLATGARRCRNVLGLLLGRSGAPTVALTAHYDHVGDDPGGVRFPGAFDNASGVAALLAAARLLARMDSERPFHLLVAFLTGEESGLWGAKRLVAHPPGPLTAVINLDGVGSEPQLTAMRLGHAQPGNWLADLAAETLAAQGIAPRWIAGRDDSAVFIRAGIPTVGLGQQPRHGRAAPMHTPDDTPDVLYPEAIMAATAVILEVVSRLARAEIIEPASNLIKEFKP
jgi:Iap family predicted aminopeptidase